MESLKDASIALALGKVVIAAAWADGEIQQEELACLKDLLFQLPELPRHCHRMLEMYLESPVTEKERNQLVEELKQLLQTDEEKQFALNALDQMIRADGVVDTREMEVVDSIKRSIAAVDTNLQKVETVVQQTLGIRREAAENREASETIRRILRDHFAQTAGATKNWTLSLSRESLQKLCLAGILMARVARADNKVDDSEVEAMTRTIAERWGVDKSQALFVSRIAVSGVTESTDLLRVCRQFHELTREDERRQFLEILFSIAMADGTLSEDEFRDIHRIAALLRVGASDLPKR